MNSMDQETGKFMRKFSKDKAKIESISLRKNRWVPIAFILVGLDVDQPSLISTFSYLILSFSLTIYHHTGEFLGEIYRFRQSEEKSARSNTNQSKFSKRIPASRQGKKMPDFRCRFI